MHCVAVILLEGGTEDDLKTLDPAAADDQQVKRLSLVTFSISVLMHFLLWPVDLL